MHAKQESVKSLIFHYDTVFLTHVYLSVLQQTSRLKRRLIRRHIVYHLY